MNKGWGIALIAGTLLPCVSAATEIIWQGETSTNWGTGTAWIGGTAPADNRADDTAIFDSASTNNPTLTAARSVASLDFRRNTAVNSDATLRTLYLTNANTRLIVTNGSTAVMNANINSLGGNNYIDAGSTLRFNFNAPAGGAYYLSDNSRLEFHGANMSEFNNNPSLRGTGSVLYNGTIASSFRIKLYNTVSFTIGTNAAVTTIGDYGFIAAFGTNTVILHKSFNLKPTAGTVWAGCLNVGVDNSDKNRTLEMTIQAGTNTLSVNSARFWGTEAFGGKAPKLIMDGGTLQVGGPDSNPNDMQGMVLTDHGGVLNSANPSSLTDLTVHVSATTNGGTIRVDSPSTFSHCNATENYGAILMVTNFITLINNRVWTNINTKSDTPYPGLVVATNATIGGTGTFYMAAGLTTNAKFCTVAGHIAPGDGGIGTLSIVASNVTWNTVGQSESAWHWDIGLSNTSDKLMITGDFLKGSGSPFYFVFNHLLPGTYVLAEWTGNTTFVPADFSTVGDGGIAQFSIAGNQLRLTVPRPVYGWQCDGTNSALQVSGACTTVNFRTLCFSSNLNNSASLLYNTSNILSYAYTHTNAVQSVDRQFYRVVERALGTDYTNTWIYTTFRRQLDPGNWYKYATGIDYGDSNTLDSTLGIQLAQGLTRDNNKELADLFYLLETNGNWSICFLNASGLWCDSGNGNATNTAVKPLQSFWIKRKAAGSTSYPVYSGYCITNSEAVTFASNDWHMITWPLPWDRKEGDGAQQGWGFAAAGAQKGTSWLNSDLLTVGDGSALRFYHLHTSGRWCAVGQSTPASTVTLHTGESYYYLHRGTGFTWTATAP